MTNDSPHSNRVVHQADLFDRRKNSATAREIVLALMQEETVYVDRWDKSSALRVSVYRHMKRLCAEFDRPLFTIVSCKICFEDSTEAIRLQSSTLLTKLATRDKLDIDPKNIQV